MSPARSKEFSSPRLSRLQFQHNARTLSSKKSMDRRRFLLATAAAAAIFFVPAFATKIRLEDGPMSSVYRAGAIISLFGVCKREAI